MSPAQKRKVHPNSIKNLKPWQPGQSGNPLGASIRKPSDIYREQFNGPLPETLQKVALKLGFKESELKNLTFGAVAIRRMMYEVIQGDVSAAKEIVDRIEGKARQSVELTLPKTESEKYEAAVKDTMEHAESIGRALSRNEAIRMIATGDPRILKVLGAELASQEV